jgi:hypothetical protein
MEHIDVLLVSLIEQLLCCGLVGQGSHLAVLKVVERQSLQHPALQGFVANS